MKFETYMAMRYLTVRHQNGFINLVAFFSIGGILVGVGALIIVLSIMNGFEDEIRSRIIDTTAHITVFSFKPEGVKDWRETCARIEDFDGVLGATPFIQSKGAIAGPKSSDGVLIRGIDPEIEERTANISRTVFWGKFMLEHSDTGLSPILLGKYLASEINARPGDTVSLFTLRRATKTTQLAGNNPLVKKFFVAGIFETGMYDYDAILSYIPLKTAQRMFGMGDHVTGIQVKISDYYKAPEAAKTIEAALGMPYYAVPWSETNKNLFSWMTLEKWGMFLVLALIIAVAAFNIVSTLIMVVMEKTPDIGILKAMGASKAAIVRIFMLQGTIVGILGTAGGAAFGWLIVFLQTKYHFVSLPPDVYSISSLPMKLREIDFFAVVALSLFLSILSAIYPAWQASKLKPVDAIRFG